MVQLHKESKDPEPLTLSCNALKTVLEGCGVDEEKISGFEERFDERGLWQKRRGYAKKHCKRYSSLR